MIVFSSSVRHARRSRRIPTVASVVRVLGTVRVSDQPDVGTLCTGPTAPRPPYGTVILSTGTRGHRPTGPHRIG